MAEIFISHANSDADEATGIIKWLGEQGFEQVFLDFDKDAGIDPGADWERTLYRQIERCQAMLIVLTPAWLASKWCFAEFTQARALGKAIFPLIVSPVGERFVAQDIQQLDLIRDRSGGLSQLARELTRIALDAQGGFNWDTARAPFPGLMAFQEEDAAIYFGREDETRRLIERLTARRVQGGAKLVSLLGASGAGKSSLLRAGVVPVCCAIRKTGSCFRHFGRKPGRYTNWRRQWHSRYRTGALRSGESALNTIRVWHFGSLPMPSGSITSRERLVSCWRLIRPKSFSIHRRVPRRGNFLNS